MTLVLATDWGVSYLTGSNIDGAILNVGKLVNEPNQWGGVGVIVNHPEFNGLPFDSVEAASEFAHEVGLLKPFVRQYSDSVEELLRVLGV